MSRCSGMFPNLQTKINDTINARLCESTDNLLTDIYNNLTSEEKIRINKKITPAILESFYPKLSIVLTSDNLQQNSKPRIEENPKKRCMARVGIGKQCSRARKINKTPNINKDNNLNGGDGDVAITEYDFCAGHLKSLPYGRIDGPLEGKALQIKKTRGRKTTKTNKNIAYSMDGLDQSHYLKTNIIQFEGQEYLIDEYGVFYSNTAENNIIARIVGDTVEWFKI